MADRFHLFCNLTQALQRVLERLASTLARFNCQSRPHSNSAASSWRPDGQRVAAVQEATEAPVKLNRHEQQRSDRREKRKALFESVRAAYQRGLTKRAIARELGITRTTVRRFLRAGGIPGACPTAAPVRTRFISRISGEALDGRLPQCLPTLPRIASARLYRPAQQGERIRAAVASKGVASALEIPAHTSQRAAGRVLANEATDAAQLGRTALGAGGHYCASPGRHSRALGATIPAGVQRSGFECTEHLAGNKHEIGNP